MKQPISFFCFIVFAVSAADTTFYLRQPSPPSDSNNSSRSSIKNDTLAAECRREITCQIEAVDVEYGEAPPPDQRDDLDNEEDEDDVDEDTPIPPVDEEFVCRLKHRVGAYDIDLPFEHQQSYHRATSKGFVYSVKVTHVCVDELDTMIRLSPSSEFQEVAGETKRQQGRGLSVNHFNPVTTRLVVVLRVSYLQFQPSLSASELQGRVFGRGSDKVSVSLRSHMDACSFGQVKFQVKRGHGISHGVADISINDEIAFGYRPVRQLENAALAAAENKLGKLKKIDNILIVLPDINEIFPSWRYNYVAYAYLNSQISVFNDKWGGYFSSLAHETAGHNGGLHHSYKKNNPYGDTTGLMGYSFQVVSGPSYCFNAQKHYILKWFESRTRRVDIADLPWTGNLAFFGDYDKAPHDQNLPVLIHMNKPGLRLFFQYNRAVGINEGTMWKRNKVVVERDDGEPGARDPIPSVYAGSIRTDGTGSFRFKRYHNSKTLVVRVCGKVANDPHYLRVSIFLEGTQEETCDEEPSYVCDDDLVSRFFVDETHGFKDCAWLQQNLGLDNNNLLCTKSNEAYEICAETCGKCSDDCEDSSDGAFFVEGEGSRNCAWLAANWEYRDKVCYPGHDAYGLCKETCNHCD